MKHYFLIAKDVGDLTAIVCAALEERQAKPSPRLARFAPFRRKREVIATGDSKLRMAVSRLPGRRFSPAIRSISSGCSGSPTAMVLRSILTRRACHQALKLIDAKLRANPEANRLFLAS